MRHTDIGFDFQTWTLRPYDVKSLGLPTGGTYVLYHEDPGETHPGSAQVYGQATPGSPLVRLPATDGSWGCHHLPAEPCLHPPGQTGEHCEGHVLWLLQCFQHHQACSTGWQADGDADGSSPCVLDCGLPHWLTTVRAPAALCLRYSGQQHRGPTRDCSHSFSLQPLHNRL